MKRTEQVHYVLVSSRSSLKIDGTLSSLITVKTHIENPMEGNPPIVLFKKPKKNSRIYNDKHK